MSVEQLLDSLRPVLDHLNALDLSDPEAVRKSLDEAFPFESGLVRDLGERFRTGVAEGWLCDREAGGARFSRVAKATGGTHDFSVDAVSLDGPGVWHRHPAGEIDLCFAAEGDPRFDGQPEGWVVFGPASDHVPTVTGGRMHILYFLPGGAVEWKR
ncbi:MAG: hypothetical protein Kow0092_28740 [Deferrisomatales bacterium]